MSLIPLGNFANFLQVALSPLTNTMTRSPDGGDDVRDEKYHFHYENDNVKAYKHIETGVVIELCCKIFGKPEEILNKFDFTITKFAWDVVRKLEWKEKCDPAENEELFLWNLY